MRGFAAPGSPSTRSACLCSLPSTDRTTRYVPGATGRPLCWDCWPRPRRSRVCVRFQTILCNPGCVLGLQFAHEFAVDVQHFQIRLRGFLAERIPDGGAGRRVLADETAIRLSATRLQAPANRRRRTIQPRIRLQRLRRQLTQSGHIEDPQTAAMRGGDDFAGRRMDGELVDGDRRQVAVQTLPRLAAIERVPDAELGAQIQQVGIFDVLAQHARRSPAARPPCSGFHVLPKSSVTKT